MEQVDLTMKKMLGWWVEGSGGGEAVPGKFLGGGEVFSFAFIFLRYNSPTV